MVSSGYIVGRYLMHLEDRFWEKVEIRDGCWKWHGAKVNGGYGALTIGPRGAGSIRAHRLSYILHKGEIPAGLLVLHECDNPECTNPEHLVLGNRADNMRHVSERKRNPLSRKTHCINGHEFTPENTISRGNRRRCRTCKNEQSKRSYKKLRGENFGKVIVKERTHCPHGHEFTPENTYLNPRGYKECVTCRRDRMERFRMRQKNE